MIAKVSGNDLQFFKSGVGVDALKSALPDDECAFALLALSLELQMIRQNRVVFLQWKGPNCSGMKKVQANGIHAKALELLEPNHGQLEVIGKTNFTEATIANAWNPASGTKVID